MLLPLIAVAAIASSACGMTGDCLAHLSTQWWDNAATLPECEAPLVTDVECQVNKRNDYYNTLETLDSALATGSQYMMDGCIITDLNSYNALVVEYELYANIAYLHYLDELGECCTQP